MSISNPHCKETQKRLLESSTDPLGRQPSAEIMAHLSHCDTCQQYHRDLLSIRKGINNIQTPQLDTQLTEKTRLRCHDRIADQQSRTYPASLPLLIKVALPIIIVLTVVWMILTLPALGTEIALTKQAVIGIILLIQNGLMLLFAPLLISGFKENKDEIKLSFR